MNYLLRIKLIAFSLTIFFLSLFETFAQDNCSEKLIDAQKLFDAGMIEQIPQLLKPCINNGFTDNERVQAEKLTILAYLFDNNITEADNAMYAFLSRNPQYEITASDPAEFVQLFQSYKIIQIGSIGVNFGSNINFINPSNIYSTNGKTGKYKNNGFNYQTGISYNYYLNKKFDINIEAYYSKSSYSYTNYLEFIGKINQTFNESFHNVEVPISLLFKVNLNKQFSCFLRAGGSLSYLISSSAEAKLDALKESLTLNMASYRNPLQFQALGGTGISYNLRKGYFLFDIRFNYGFMNVVNSSKRDKTSVLNELYLYNENDFILHNLYFSIGYYYKFNKPEKSNY